MTDHFKEPLPPGVKNLDNYEIDFPEHNLEDYVMHSKPQIQNSLPYEKAAKEFYEKKEDPQFLVDANMDTLDHEADKYEERMKIQAEQTNGYFDQEVTDEMLPDWMKDNSAMHDTEPSDWT